MAAQESTAKIKVVLDTSDAESVLERMNDSLGGRGPGQGAGASASPARAGEAPTPGGNRPAPAGGGVIGGGVVGKLSQIIKLLAVVAALSKLLEPVIALAKVYMEGKMGELHEATQLDELGAQAEMISAMRVFAEKLGRETHARSPQEVRDILEMMRPVIEAQENGALQGRRAGNALWR